MKVLIPVDGSTCSENTLTWATQLLNHQTNRYVLLHVIPHGVPELVTEVFQVDDALKLLKKSEQTLIAAGCTVEKTAYSEGDPVSAICKFAEAENVDQILLGSHGRTGLAKLLLGSISTGVLEHCKKPVFIYKNLSTPASA